MKKKIKISIWNKCYPSNWRGLLVPGAQKHPAKFSSKLIRQIYDHLQGEGWIKPGQRILDPFGGVGLGALEAMRHGYGWRGVELEKPFADLGAQNIALWEKKFRTMPGWCFDAKIIQADSRHIRKNKSADPKAGFYAVISSPPFRQTSGGKKASKGMDPALMARHSAGNAGAQGYGKTEGQLANKKEKEFWIAAREIVDQCFAVLQPGGHALWVVKDFVKGGKIIPFTDQWRELCESAGFITLHEHHAEFARHNGTSLTLDGGEVQHIKTSKSFFRRVREAKGTPPIDYETVLCMIKPESK